MSLLNTNTTPAERFIGCTFAENFKDNQSVVSNGGTINGNPVICDGADLDGTSDYIKYDLGGNELNSSSISFVVEFNPDFDTDDNSLHVFFDTPVTDRYLFYKTNNASSNTLILALGSTTIANIAEATYSPFWKVNERNVIVISGTSGDTNAWLNGNQILTNDNTAWTPDNPVSMTIGTDIVASNFFDGTFKSFKVFHTLLTEQDAINYYNNSNYNYLDNAVVNLPMRACQHDPDNTQTLDVSGNGNHGTLASSPTKLADRGYNFDLTPYITTEALPTSTGTMFSLFDSASAISDAVMGSADTINVDNCYLGVNGNGELGAGIGTDSFATIKSSESAAYKTILGTVTWDGTTVDLYENGKNVYSAAQNGSVNTNRGIYVGSFNLAGTQNSLFTGNIRATGMLSVKLTELQQADLYIKLMAEINKI